MIDLIETLFSTGGVLMSTEAEKQIAEAIYILEQIGDDTGVPRNIRKIAQQSIEILNDKSQDLQVRAINAIELLDETTSDPNCPLHTRTMIYQVIARLELPPEEEEEEE